MTRAAETEVLRGDDMETRPFDAVGRAFLYPTPVPMVETVRCHTELHK